MIDNSKKMLDHFKIRLKEYEEYSEEIQSKLIIQ